MSKGINKKGHPRLVVLLHLFVLCLLVGVAIFFIGKDANATISDYISGAGSVASIYAIVITLRQIVKKTDELKVAIDAKTKEISSFLTYADIEKHIEKCNSIYGDINGGQYEAAAMKLDDIRKLLIDIRERRPVLVDVSKVNKLISDIGNDSVNLRNCWISNGTLDNKIIFKHIKKLLNELSNVAANIKSEQL